MGGGCDSPRSWERDDRESPSLTSYSSIALKAALEEVLLKEAKEKKEDQERKQLIKENRIKALKKELMELESE